MNHKSAAVAKKIALHFAEKILDKITDDEWQAFFDKNFSHVGMASKARYLAALSGIFAWLEQRPRRWLPRRPDLEKFSAYKAQKKSPRRRVVDLRPDLLTFLLDHAAINLRAQLYVVWTTGARSSSVLFGCRLADLSLVPGKEQITFHDTKNGDSVTAPLHEAAVKVLREYLDRRGNLHDRDGPLFLTDDGKPYSDNLAGQSGGQTKTAFNGMKRRAVATLLKIAAAEEAAGDGRATDSLRADADLISQITMHWLRHWLASHATDVRMAMAQGGWRDPRSVMRYRHAIDEAQREAVASLPIGPSWHTPDTPLLTGRKK